MKKLVFSLCVALSFVLMACDSVNPSEQYLGVYSFNATGDIEFSIAGASYTMPLNENGTFTMSAVDDEGRVVLTGYNDSIYGTISGKKLFFESTTMTKEYNGMTILLTFVYGTGTFEGNQLTWTTDVQGSASGTVMNIPVTATGSGTVLMTATKAEQ